MSEDPIGQGAKPPFEERPPEAPGVAAGMTLRPDYGAKTHEGHGRLEGTAALINGGVPRP